MTQPTTAPVWTPGPSLETVHAIRDLTTQDSHGHLYFKTAFHEGWRRLRTQADYDKLNKIIEPYRKVTNNAT